MNDNVLDKLKEKYNLNKYFWVKLVYENPRSSRFTTIKIIEPTSPKVDTYYDNERRGYFRYVTYSLNELISLEKSGIKILEYFGKKYADLYKYN